MSISNADDGQSSNHKIVFSKKEEAVIHEILTNAPHKVISGKLNMSISALEYHIRNIMNKTRCNSKNELINFLNERESVLKEAKNFNNKFLSIGLAIAIIIISTGIFFLMFRSNNTQITAISGQQQFQEDALERAGIVGRVTDILRIQNGLRIVAIVGEGGAGKTFLGRKILSLYQAPIRWEINAETPNSTYNSFIELANHLATNDEQVIELEKIKDIQVAEEKRKRLINFVSKFLYNAGEWCLLFDNVDSIEKVRSYIPHNLEIFGKGSVIITTRDTDIGDVDFIRSSNVVNIRYLSDEEQSELFCKILYKKKLKELDNTTQEKVREFLNNIPKMPLDVVAAAYYLKNTKIPFAEYKAIMENSYRDLTRMQERLLEKNVNYSRTRYGIVSSVFKEMLGHNKNFKPLLFFICLMDSQNIPKKLLREMIGMINADDFISRLRQDSLVVDDEETISIHRSTQSIGLDYMISTLTQTEKESMIIRLINRLNNIYKSRSIESLKLLPHAEAILEKLKLESFKDLNIGKEYISLLLLAGDIYKRKTHRMLDALKCLKKALELNEELNCLDAQELASIKLKIGDVCTIINKNTEAEKYLSESLKIFTVNSMKKVRNYRLLGIIRMRQHEFDGANECFIAALSILKSIEVDSLTKKLSESNIYEDMSFNYFMDGINRENAKKAVPLMERAIKVLEDSEISKLEGVVSRKLVHKIKLAGIHNALAHYQTALNLAQETEELISALNFDNSDIFYVQGLIARERGLAYLRLNEVSKAYGYFEKAREILKEIMKGDYLFKIKMHEAECLVRLDRLDEAFAVCEDMFAEKDREMNNYSNLFFNTCYYHAAIIKYRQRELEESKKYFEDFVRGMNVFCKEILPTEDYNKLVEQNAFGKNLNEMKKYFENSLKIFEAIYWKDYEFIKYYVEKNIDLIKSS